MSRPSQLVRGSSTGRRAAGAALCLLCSSACGDAEDLERPAAYDPTHLNCNAPLPETFIAQMTGATEPAPPVPEAAALASMGLVEPGSRDAHSLLAVNPQERPYKVFVPEYCVPLGEVYTANVKICVDVAGNVSGVTVLMDALPIIDSQLPYVLSLWRYEPYLVEGTPTPFCYQLNYAVR